MKRRAFLGVLGATLALNPWENRAGAPSLPELSPSDICRTPTASSPDLIAAVESAGGLSYQGTHILTHGALRDLAASFAGSGRGTVAVAGGDCDDGIVGVRRKTVHLGGMCCPVKGSAAEGLPSLLVARDLKAVVIHASNPVPDIGIDELKAVARGRIGNWKQIGGVDRPIAQVVRRHCPGYFEPVRGILLGNRPDWSPRALFVDTDEQVVDLVSRFPAGLGVVSWVFARPLVEQGRLGLLAVNGMRPDRQPHRYPIVGPLSLVFRAWDPSRMAPFFDFLFGAEGRAIIARQLIPVSAQEAGYRSSAPFGRA